MRYITGKTRTRRLAGITAFVALVAVQITAGASPAGAETVGSGSARGFGATVDLGGESAIPPTPEAVVDAPTADAEETTIDIPAEPIVVNGTLTARANVHRRSDVASGLTVVDQDTAGPYNARGLGQIENLNLVYEVAGEGVPLVSATAVRAEAAAVCSGDTVAYTANSEIIDLQVGGEPIPLNAPVQDLIDAIGGALTESGLNAVVDVQRNVVAQLEGGGIAVDALVVTLLAAAGDAPLAQVRLAHGEVGPTACGDAPECEDGIDNDGDGVIDEEDPECHTDGDAGNPDSYDPTDDDESNGGGGGGGGGGDGPAGGTLPRTGAEASLPVIGGMLLVASAGALALRRLAA